MREPTRGPLFACLYQGLCDVARANGYALAIHGTLVNDMDLIAVPWTEEAIAAEDLVAAIREHIGAVGYADLLRRDSPFLSETAISQIVERDGGLDATEKPHGRRAWNLYLYAGAKVDLSILPR